MISVDKVSKVYDNQTQALSEVSFKVKEGEIIYIVGESGSGKSTLLRTIAGLEDADTGTITVDEEQITGPLQNLVPGYDNIAYVPQDFKLQQFWTVRDNIGKNISFYSPKDKKERVDELLSLFNLMDKAESYPPELSGGQKQRIAIAAALSDEPDVILLDEPFSNLDRPMKVSIRHEIITMLRAAEVTVLLVTHDPADALSAADRIIIMEKGTLAQIDSPARLYNQPNSLYTGKFLGPINSLTYKKEKILIRPEKMSIDPNGDLEGKVIRSLYFGMHFHIYINSDLSEEEILIYSEENLSGGTKVNFNISALKAAEKNFSTQLA